MKINYSRYIPKTLFIIPSFIALLGFKTEFLNAQEQYLNDIETNSSTKLEDDSSGLPTNPFEFIEMIRRANSMNEATNPSDAIDDALKSFNKIEEKD